MSDIYALLKKAYREKLVVKGRYHEKDRLFEVIQLGWTDGRERCLAFQRSPQLGWRCLDVDELSEVALTEEAAEGVDADFRGRCVEVVDRD